MVLDFRWEGRHLVRASTIMHHEVTLGVRAEGEMAKGRESRRVRGGFISKGLAHDPPTDPPTHRPTDSPTR